METKTMKDHKKLLKEVYGLLNEGNINFKIDWIEKTTLGLYEYNGDETKITINVYELILQCLLHECLHEIKPKLGDYKKKTDKMATWMLRKMTQRQKAYLFRKLMSVVQLPKRRLVKKITVRKR